MRFLVDECAGTTLACWLKEQGHDTFSVYDQARGITDDEVIRLAFTEMRILITSDKDFGEKIFRGRDPHHGVILLRLKDERAKNKIAALERLLADYSDRLEGQFVVVTDTLVRIANIKE